MKSPNPIFRLALFRLALLAKGVSMRILRFGLKELDPPPLPETPCVEVQFGIPSGHSLGSFLNAGPKSTTARHAKFQFLSSGEFIMVQFCNDANVMNKNFKKQLFHKYNM